MSKRSTYELRPAPGLDEDITGMTHVSHNDFMWIFPSTKLSNSRFYGTSVNITSSLIKLLLGFFKYCILIILKITNNTKIKIINDNVHITQQY